MNAIQYAASGAIFLSVANASAAYLGVSTTTYHVVDGARNFAVMDIYVDCSGAYDKLTNYYGTTLTPSFARTTLNEIQNAGNAATATNGAPFSQANATSWAPSASPASNAWDSFVTIGARNQNDAGAGITGDPFFSNFATVEATTVQGGADGSGTFVGAGWYTSTPTTNNYGFAGTYADMRIMLGRFSVETTSFSSSDVLSMQLQGSLTMLVNGTSPGTGTFIQPIFNQTFAFDLAHVPSPGLGGLMALAGFTLRSRRR